MTREELKEHCKKQVEQIEMWAKHRGEEPSGRIYEEHKLVLELFEQEPKTGHWIPVTYKPMTEEEKKDYAEYTGYDINDLDFMLDCPLPDDGETVLITDRLGNVEEDTFIKDSDGCYFECNCDMDDIKAWMPLPEPYEDKHISGKE